MTQRWLGIVGLVLPALLGAQTGRGPYARIAVLRPHDGQTVEFEAGYIRHLAWHRQAGDPWVWYGWGGWARGPYPLVLGGDVRAWAAGLDRAVGPVDHAAATVGTRRAPLQE